MTKSPATPDTILTDHYFDGFRFHREPTRITLVRGKIAAVTPLASLSHDPATTTIDARGSVVIPGLVNAHVHIARAGFVEPHEPPLQIRQIIMNLQGALAAGVTTVADMGCTVPMLARLRALTESDPLAGPRIVGAGPMLSAPEGYPFNWIPPLWRHTGTAAPVSDATTAARAVATTVEAGMDHVKIAVMHESFARSPLPTLTVAAARAVVDEAHRLGRRVYAHAHSTRDYEVALDAGVDGLMHSSFDPLTRDLVARIRDAGIAVNPTLWAYDSTCHMATACHHLRPELRRHATPALRASWQRFVDAYAISGPEFPATSTLAGVPKAMAEEAMRIAAANTRLLHEAGVPLVFGNDASFGVALLARPIDELRAMAGAGLDAQACLAAATSGAARLLGRSDLGVIAPGAAADLVIAPASIAHDISALDADRKGSALTVITRGHLVPKATDAARAARIAWAYVDGTARTFGRALASLTRATLSSSGPA